MTNADWDDLPEYVPRDFDGQFRQSLRSAASRGGFVLLVGSSSVGKTRCAYEAVRAVLPDWNLLIPDNAASVRRLVESGKTQPRTVVWLDEMQRFLDEDGGSGLNRSDLLRPPRPGVPIVFVGTMWPARYEKFMDHAAQLNPAVLGDNRYSDAREVLRIADVVHVADEFSQAERMQAARLAENDDRLRQALKESHYGVTQFLAGAPALVRRWRSSDPYTAALVTAAIDCNRLGIQSPLSALLLPEIAQLYLSEENRARAAPDWFPRAVERAIATDLGVSLLVPHDGGYSVADYLLQYGAEVRSDALVPAELWEALARHISDSRDLGRLAEAAAERGQYKWAEQIYHRAFTGGNISAVARLASLLAAQGRGEEAVSWWRIAIAAGDLWASYPLADYLVRHGQVDEAIGVLSELLGVVEGFTATYCLALLAQMVAEHRSVDDAIALYRAAIAGGHDVRDDLVSFLVSVHREDDALAEYRQLDNVHPEVRARVMDALASRGRFEEIIAEYKRVIESGADDFGWWQLAEVLEKGGQLEGAVTAYRHAVDIEADARIPLARLLMRMGRVGEGLTEFRAAIGVERGARLEMLHALVEFGRADEAYKESRSSAEYGDLEAQRELISVLERVGRIDEAVTLCHELVAKGGTYHMRIWLARLLDAADRLDEAAAQYRLVAATGSKHALGRLIELLHQQGRSEEAERVRRYGLRPDGSTAREGD